MNIFSEANIFLNKSPLQKIVIISLLAIPVTMAIRFFIGDDIMTVSLKSLTIPFLAAAVVWFSQKFPRNMPDNNYSFIKARLIGVTGFTVTFFIFNFQPDQELLRQIQFIIVYFIVLAMTMIPFAFLVRHLESGSKSSIY